MSTFDNPFDPDRRLSSGCSCGQHASEAEHQRRLQCAGVESEDKRYEGKGHKVAKQGDVTIGGTKGAYLLTTWKDGGNDMEKHTALMLKDGHRYLVVMSGAKGKVDKKVFDHAVSSFALVPASK